MRPTTISDGTRLVLLSFLMLFVELALIRWLASNIIYLSYFSNFVLLGSFLGIGIGFLRAPSKKNHFVWAPVILALLIAFVLIAPVTVDCVGSQIIYFGCTPSGSPIWVTLPIIFLAVALTMTSIAQEVAASFALFAPLEAYRLDILGSLAGIVGFSLLSFLGAPPVVWGIVVAWTFLLLERYDSRFSKSHEHPSDTHQVLGHTSERRLNAPDFRKTALRGIALAGMLLLLGKESLSGENSWSPYYKITVFPVNPGVYELNVNGIPHQMIESTAERKRLEPIYFVPYQRLTTTPGNVLIVGAGNGSDAAIALAAGARHVDAVEIDPRILQIGRRMNPDHPYQQSRVTIHNDDGRAFLQRTHDRYDLILFSLPDSLALVSGQSSLRLESYLFTREALKAARDHLNPGGVFGMYNYYRRDWLLDRLAGTLTTIYGHRPCVDTMTGVGKFSLLLSGTDDEHLRCATIWAPSALPVPDPVDDDHPFPYLRTPSIPPLYLFTLAAIALAAFLAIRATSGPITQMRGYLDLFFMGTAFLLLETKNVVQFALLFGTTWFVNALVFFGILLSVFLAIELARRMRFRHPARMYAALFAVLALAWAIPTESLLSLDAPLRFIIACALAFAPIFLANLIFAERFREVGSSTTAFAANLLGSMVGGLLEYCSLVVGYRNLLLLLALLYLCAWICSPRRDKRTAT